MANGVRTPSRAPRLLLALAAIGGVLLPSAPLAAVGRGAGGWTFATSASTSVTVNITPDTGSNRLLVVIIAGSNGATASTTAPTCTLSYGGQTTYTTVVGSGTVNISRKACIVIMKEAQIAAATSPYTLTATLTPASSGVRIAAAFFTGVDQTNPIPATSGSSGNGSTNQNATYAAAITTPANGATVVGAAGRNDATGSSISTSTYVYTNEQATFSNTNVAIGAFDRLAGTSAETDTVTHSFATSTSSSAIVGAALAPAATSTVTVAPGTPTAPNVAVGPSTPALLNAFTLQASSGSPAVTAVAVNVSSITNVASLSIHSTSACGGDTAYGTLSTGLVSGANTISLGTSIGATTTATTYYLCLTSAATVTASSTATGSVTGATASGFTSAGSSAAQGTVTINTPPPGAPGTPTYTNVASTSVTVSWTSGTGATSYNLLRASDSACTTNVTTFTNVTSPRNDTGLPGSTTYYYCVVAVNSGGSTQGAGSSVTTAAPGSAGKSYNISCDTGTTGNAELYSFTLGTQFKVRCQVIDQATGAGVTGIPSGSLTVNGIRNVSTNVGLFVGTNYTVGTFTEVGGGVYDQLLTISTLGTGGATGNILRIEMRDTGGTDVDAQYLSASQFVRAGTAGVAGNAQYVEVQPSSSGDIAAAAGTYPVQVKFIDATGAAYNPGTLTWSVNRWRDTNGATTLTPTTSVASATWNAGGWYDVTLNYSNLTAGNREYVVLQATTGNYTFYASIGLTAVTNESATTLAVPTFTVPYLFQPGAPGTPTYSNVGSSSVTVSWTAGTGATSYNLLRASNSACTTNVTTLTNVTSPYADTGLTANTTYYYCAVSVNSAGTAQGSGSSVLTLAGAPAAPTFANVAQTTLTVNWTAPLGGTATYTVQRSPDGTTWTSVATGLTGLTYGDTGLTQNTLYYYRVVAVNASGSSPGAPASVTTLATPPGNPGTPTYTNVATTSVSVSWTAGTGATSYNLLRATNSTCTTGVTTFTGVTSPYSDSGLTGNTTYYYCAVSVNSGGTAQGTGSSVLTLPAVPGTPTYSSVTASSLTVSWTAPTGGAASYTVQRSLDNVTFSNVATGLTGTSYGDTGLSAGTTYYYRIAAVNASGTTTGASSSTTTLTVPPPGTPGTPTYSSIAGTSVTVSWTAASGATSYNLQRATDSGFTQNVATFTGVTSPYADSGLAGSTTYWYRVVAVNAGGSTTGAASSVTTLAGPPGAPGTPTYATIAQTTLTVSWTAALGTVTSYTVQRSTDGMTFTNAVTGVTGLTWNATGLTANTQYWFRIVAVNGNGSTTGTASTVTTLSTAPGTPGTPTYSSVGSTTLTVSWSSASGATSYDLQRDTSSAFTSPTTFTNVTSPYADSGLSPSTTYWYRVVARNAGGSTTGGSSSVTTVANPSLAVTLGSTVAAANIAAGSSGTLIGRIALTPANGTVTLNALSVSNVLSGGGSGTAVAGTDVAGLDLFDVTGATTVFVGSAAWNSTTSHYDFTNLAYNLSAARTFAVTLDVGPGATAARTFAMNVTVPADVTVASPSTVSNTTPLQGNTFTISAGTGAGSTATNAPMVSIINPASATVVSPNPGFKVQIRVFNMVGNKGVDGVSTVKLSADNGATFPYSATGNTQYDAIYNDPSWATTVTGRTYEVVVSNLAQGSYTLRAQAVNTVPQTVLSEPVQVVVAAAGKGDGNLLVRDNSAQLCTDCHAVQTHSSEALGTTYGAWATTCRDCHTPHRTRNVALVRESITPPSVNGIQPAKNVGFVKFTGDSNTAGWDTTNGRPTVDASFVNTTDRSGPCQVCHTRTVNPANGTPRWRNSGNSDTHWVSPNTAACTGCHSHKVGFAPGESTGGAACGSCHTPIWNAMTGATAGLASKHQLGNVSGTNDSPTDSGVSWSTQTALGNVTPAQRSCVNMCHGDHPHDIQTDTTHSYNLYADSSTATSRGNTATRTTSNRARSDFDPATNTGMCATCHAKPIATGGITVAAATFGASAHDFTSNTAGGTTYTWQYSLHKGTTDRNCTKCHASRTEGTTPTAGANGSTASAVHGTQDDSLLAGTKNPAGTPTNFVCYNCHGSTASPANGAQGNRSGKDIQSQILHATTAGQSGHPANSDTVHNTVAEYANAAFGNALGVAAGTGQRHASCMDCHDTHAAKSGTRTIGGANGNTIGGALEGTWGVKLGTGVAAWAAPASTDYTKVALTTATPGAGQDNDEASLCFKCHSNYYGTLPNAPSSVGLPAPISASGYQETNVAQEFNPANAGNWKTAGLANQYDSGETAGSFHPVLADCSNNLGAVNLTNLSTANFAWSTTTRNTMRCSDCHASDVNTDPVGPHGSAAKFLLRGPNTKWDVTINSISATGTFCANCHQLGTYSRYSAHTDHAGKTECFTCHVAIPHGSMRFGLLTAGNGGCSTAGGCGTSSQNTNAGFPLVACANGNTTAVQCFQTDNPPYNQADNTYNKLHLVAYPASQATTINQTSYCGCGNVNGGTGH